MIKKIDVKGLDCPIPVIKTKNALEEMSNGILEVYLCDDIPKENIIKFVKSMGYEYDLVKDESDEKIIKIIKGESSLENIEISETKSNVSREIIIIDNNKLGKGNDELGAVLIKGFIYTLTETKPYPESIIFINGGVELTTINDATVENLLKLEEKGVEILSCGTCLDYYNLKDSLKVGTVTNMYTIVEKIKTASNVINMG